MKFSYYSCWIRKLLHSTKHSLSPLSFLSILRAYLAYSIWHTCVNVSTNLHLHKVIKRQCKISTSIFSLLMRLRFHFWISGHPNMNRLKCQAKLLIVFFQNWIKFVWIWETITLQLQLRYNGKRYNFRKTIINIFIIAHVHEVSFPTLVSCKRSLTYYSVTYLSI